ncbi:hypothetical protein JR316_0000189 [Psilocybe cubensis]|uniref:Uncharacterized protein n=2 Tax=Psilocybe cubensis TaxID=181762 RepID=A0A8H8CQ13_PSICU|nr:hypothetical protein JR316_0000189 [Psilocybe cubensis]KAH9486125.1 hypothetical protein JR316_0000189 [Psilocybe cubensis]
MAENTFEYELPDGYILVLGPDNRDYIVPEFMAQSLEQALAVQLAKSNIGVTKASGIDPAAKNTQIYNTLGGNLHVPPEPPLTDQERLSLHAEVCSLQQRLGISYKDAAHRLYLAEVEKLQLANTHRKALGALDRHIRKSLQFIAERHSVNEGQKSGTNDKQQ